MTDILPPAGWPNVRQLETNEFATGGANGNMNEQAKSLAARSELLKQYAALPYESKTGGYALNERVQLATGDIVRSTIASNVNNPNENMTGWFLDSSDANIKTWSGRTQEQENKALAKSVFYHVDNLIDAEKYTGYIVEYRGKHFKVSVEPSKDIRHPVIRSGSSYLIPIDHTAVNFNLSDYAEVGLINNPSEFSKPNGKSQQGILIDNKNNSIFVSSCEVDESLITGKIFEYDFTDGVLGNLKSSSGLLSIGHADFFAITIEGNVRNLWFYKPKPETGQYGVGGDLVRVPWSNGCTDSNIDLTISSIGFDVTRRLEVTNFDADNLLIRGQYDYIIPISEMNDGRLSVIDKKSWQWTENVIEVVAPRQQSKGICNVQASASGVFVKQDNSVFVGLSAIGMNKATVAKVNQASEDADCEIEGLDFYWDSEKLQYNPIISTWAWNSGIVKIYNLASRNNIKNTLFSMKYLTTSLGGQTSSNARNALHTPMNMSCSGLLIGGSQSPSRTGDLVYKPEDFFIEQWSNGNAGRFGARIVYDTSRIMIDSSKDTVLPDGYRYQINNTVGVQIVEDGVNIGKSRNKDTSQLSCLDVKSENIPAIHARALENDMPAYVASSNRVDYAGTGSIKFGTYTEATNIATRIGFLNATMFSPYTTNSLSLGQASAVFKDLYIKNAPIISSDERLKQQFRSMSESEKSVALEIKNSICMYKFNDAVDLKGDGARWHCGVKAQQVVSILESHGLNWQEYAFICLDEWGATDEQEAGSRYAIRYDELTMFILAAL